MNLLASAHGPARRPRLAPIGATLVICAMGALGFACQGRSRTPQPDAAAQRDSGVAAGPVELDVYAFGRQLGTVAPCGCTTEPLGGLQFAFGHIEHSSTPGARLVVAPGSLLYPELDGPEAPTDAAGWDQAEARARVLHERFSALGDAFVVGLGPADLGSPDGAAAIERFPLPRVLSNAAPEAELPPGVRPWREVALTDGRRARVWAVVDPAHVAAAATPPPLEPRDDDTESGTGDGAAASASTSATFPPLIDPLTALRDQVGPDSAQTLDVVIVEGPRELAETLARQLPGVDLVIMGGALEGTERQRLGAPAAKVGAAWVLEPGDRGQTLAHLSLGFDAEATPGVPAATSWANQPPRSQLEAELARVQERLTRFEAEPGADPAFLEQLRKQRDQLQRQVEGEAPREGTVAVFDQVKVTCKLPADPGAKAALGRYDAWVSASNQRRFAGVETPEPPAGAPTYVGDDSCATCHEEAMAWWKKSRHAGAYATLVDADKQFDLSCVGCHVTGFRQPGGAEVVETRGLVNVQCEQCHGPGSLHADDPEPTNIRLEAPVTLCLDCHTEEHSDTFEYEAYLRDVLGTGHGDARRAELGPGPTGRELRAAGFAKAGGACPKGM